MRIIASTMMLTSLLFLAGCPAPEPYENDVRPAPPQTPDYEEPVMPDDDWDRDLRDLDRDLDRDFDRDRDRDRDQLTAFQPEYTLTIDVMESAPEQYAANWEVTVNTGGWTMQTDRIDLEDGVLRIYITLEQPGHDDIVTQAFETHRERHDAGTDVIERAELHVNRTVRGEPAAEPDYERVATAP